MKIRRQHLLFAFLFGCFGLWLLLLGLEQALAPRDETCDLIEPGLYMGAFIPKPPPRTRAVLNLCASADTYACESHLWEPIRDGEPAPTVEWLQRMVTWVQTQRQQGLTTFVHCRNGVSRSGLVVVAYLMFQHHWTRDQALAYVRSKRSITRPNPAFLELLTAWERALQQ